MWALHEADKPGSIPVVPIALGLVVANVLIWGAAESSDRCQGGSIQQVSIIYSIKYNIYNI